MIEIALAVVTVIAVAVATYAWWHARKWALLISYGRIAVEFKGKVKMDAPLREWALWCNQTKKDKSQPAALRGHVIYAMGGTRIALFGGVKHPKVKKVKPRPGGPQRIQKREGVWGEAQKESNPAA